MQAPPTVSDRIRASLEKASKEGNAVTKFILGRSEMECLKEWCRMDEYSIIDEACDTFTFMGVTIEPVGARAYFAYEVVELAVV